ATVSTIIPRAHLAVEGPSLDIRPLLLTFALSLLSGMIPRTGSGKYAHVMTMKKLARMIHHMMLTEQNWRWENEELTERKLGRLSPRGGELSV
ncbi:MAG: hypothetical protein JRN15_14860, partial [Nitrososphaerota archaeon]|nr:hypothetical protein [Nitrososphaerota archaeon]